MFKRGLRIKWVQRINSEPSSGPNNEAFYECNPVMRWNLHYSLPNSGGAELQDKVHRLSIFLV